MIVKGISLTDLNAPQYRVIWGTHKPPDVDPCSISAIYKTYDNELHYS